MAKHPVPKKKVSSERSKKRYAAFVHKKHVKLLPFTQIKPCTSCGKPMLLSVVCKNCGKYRGRQVLNMGKRVAKITKVKA